MDPAAAKESLMAGISLPMEMEGRLDSLGAEDGRWESSGGGEDEAGEEERGGCS